MTTTDRDEPCTWEYLDEVPNDVLVVRSGRTTVGRTTDGRWACMDPDRYKRIMPS